MPPLAQSDGHDAPGLRDEVVPGIAAVIDDIALGAEDGVGELIPTPDDQNPCAQLRMPMDIMRQGCVMSLFQAPQQ